MGQKIEVEEVRGAVVAGLAAICAFLIPDPLAVAGTVFCGLLAIIAAIPRGKKE